MHDNCIVLTENNGKGIYAHYIIDNNDFKGISGENITFSIDVKVSNLKTGNMFFQIYCTDKNNTLHRGIKLINKESLSTEWKRFFVSLKLPNDIKACYLDIGSIDELNIYGSIVNTDCLMFIKNAKLEIGSLATPFVPRSYGEELALCQRYYEVIPRLAGMANPNIDVIRTVGYYKATKRVDPTITYFWNNEINKVGCVRTSDNQTISVTPTAFYKGGVENIIVDGALGFVGYLQWETRIVADAEIY